MCGISGYAGYNKNEEFLKKITQIIAHRGPDDEGLFTHQSVGLGMRRLSIIDTVGGKQPIFNEDKSIVIVLNGEIYNYRSLMSELKQKGHHFSTHSDTETIVHLYEEMGIDCVQKLRGMFAFALYDIKKDILYLARDRIGIKPLYFHFKNSRLVFSSEVKAILEFPGIDRTPNTAAIDSFLKLRFISGNQTMFSGINKLPAAHWLSFQQGNIRVQEYWNPANYVIPEEISSKKSLAEYQEQFNEIFAETIKIHLESDVPIGSYLSGGLDSSLVTSEAAQLYSHPIHTFCVGFGWAGDETANARNIAQSLHTNHHEIICKPEDLRLLPQLIWHYDEPVGDPIALPTYLLSKLARDHVKVVLTGEGADEVLAGYLFHRVLDITKQTKNILPAFTLDSILSPFIQKLPVQWMDSVFDYPAFLGTAGRNKIAQYAKLAARGSAQELYEFLITLFDKNLRAELYLDPEKLLQPTATHSSNASFFNQCILAQFSSWLPDNILLRQDKLSMANSIEARVPFLDHVLVEFLLGVPKHLKLNSFLGKNKILARNLAEKRLPKKVGSQKKTAFYIPTENYFQNPVFLDLIEATLNKTAIKNRGYFHPQAIADLIKIAKTGKEFIAAKQVFALVSLELWHQIFIERKSWS